MEMVAKSDVQWDAESVVAWVLAVVAHLVEHLASKRAMVWDDSRGVMLARERETLKENGWERAWALDSERVMGLKHIKTGPMFFG